MRDSKIGYYIETPKTKNGYREIPMSEPVYRVLKWVLKNRRKKATITVDGYTNFLFLKEDGTPKVGINYNSMIKGLVKKYNKQLPYYVSAQSHAGIRRDMQKTLPNGKWRKRLKIKALPPFAELHKVRTGNYKIFRINFHPIFIFLKNGIAANCSIFSNQKTR